MPIPFIMPKMDMDQESVTIIEWLKKEGDHVEKGEPVIVVETDKITSEVEAPASGTLAGLLYLENEVTPVTKVVAYILRDGETEADIPTEEKPNDQEGEPIYPVQGSAQKGKIETALDHDDVVEEIKTRVKTPATPLARKMADDEAVDISQIAGSGPRGRVQAADVKAHLSQEPGQTIFDEQTDLAGETLDVSIMRQRIAEKLISSYQTIPHIYLTVEVDMSRLEAIRKMMNEMGLKEGLPKISLTAYMVRIIASCLKRHPYLNASLENKKITFWKEINIGIATALENGLIVPVIQNADQMMVNELNKQIMNLAKKARDGELTLSEIQGGTFTISNMGMFGIHSFTSIINPPQSAILSVGAIKRRPVVVDDEDSINVRPMMMMKLAADHRIVDGAVAAGFLVDLVEKLEKPETLSL